MTPVCLGQPRSNKRYCKLLLELNNEEEDDSEGCAGLLILNTFRIRRLVCSEPSKGRADTFFNFWWWRKSCDRSSPVVEFLLHWLSFFVKTKSASSSSHRLHSEGKFIRAKGWIKVYICEQVFRDKSAQPEKLNSYSHPESQQERCRESKSVSGNWFQVSGSLLASAHLVLFVLRLKSTFLNI